MSKIRPRSQFPPEILPAGETPEIKPAAAPTPQPFSDGGPAALLNLNGVVAGYPAQLVAAPAGGATIWDGYFNAAIAAGNEPAKAAQIADEAIRERKRRFGDKISL